MTEIKAEVNFVQLVEDVGIIKKVLLGNGVKGLCERVDNIEKVLIKGKELESYSNRLTSLETWQLKSYRVIGITFGIGAVLGVVIGIIAKVFF